VDAERRHAQTGGHALTRTSFLRRATTGALAALALGALPAAASADGLNLGLNGCPAQKIEHPFAPVPKSSSCTLIYGGPETADVTGTFRGRPLNAHFERGNGCEIARWNSVKFLFPTS
jgi:hypothetical protein